MHTSEPPSVVVTAFLPENFLNKSVNEPFIQRIMQIVLGRSNWVPGNANCFEPDYFCDGIPFEFTIASDRKNKGNYIQKFVSGRYTTEDMEQDIFQYIRQSVQKKLEKQYSVPNVHLCVLCLMDLTYWVLDEYGSVTHCVLDYTREEFFEWIKGECIDTKKFNNVFVIFPDMAAKWWVWDVKTGYKASVQLSTENILSKKYPFWINNDAYEKLLRQIDCDDQNNHIETGYSNE